MDIETPNELESEFEKLVGYIKSFGIGVGKSNIPKLRSLIFETNLKHEFLESEYHKATKSEEAVSNENALLNYENKRLKKLLRSIISKNRSTSQLDEQENREIMEKVAEKERIIEDLKLENEKMIADFENERMKFEQEIQRANVQIRSAEDRVRSMKILVQNLEASRKKARFIEREQCKAEMTKLQEKIKYLEAIGKSDRGIIFGSTSDLVISLFVQLQSLVQQLSTLRMRNNYSSSEFHRLAELQRRVQRNIEFIRDRDGIVALKDLWSVSVEIQ